jgi:transglutaminase-like putative cysteine protease
MTTSPTRTLSAHLEADVTAVAEIVISIAVAEGADADESLTLTVDGQPVAAEVVDAVHGTRLHLVRDVPVGKLVVDYRAEVRGAVSPPVADAARDASERITYLRPSRYCESDTLAGVAAAEFEGLAGKELLDAVSSWVGQHLRYVGGSGRPTDGAVQTYLARAGVCRDFAHLVVALLRARGVPARVVSVYAPGLAPMDFHAVAEARLEEGWCVVDATTLAPRPAMVRIATGRDASDTAFLTVQSGRVAFTGLRVTATSEPDLPADDVTQLVQLA